MFSWFSTRDLKTFAAQVTEEFELTYSSETAAGSEDKKKHENKRKKAVGDLLRKVTDYQRKHQLWLFKKARLCKLIQNELLRRNYPTDFIDKLANDLVFRVTAGVKRPI